MIKSSLTFADLFLNVFVVVVEEIHVVVLRNNTI